MPVNNEKLLRQQVRYRRLPKSDQGNGWTDAQVRRSTVSLCSLCGHLLLHSFEKRLTAITWPEIDSDALSGDDSDTRAQLNV